MRPRETLRKPVFETARQLGWAVLGRFARIPVERQWIQFLFYHEVLDEQRRSFRRQIISLQQFGEFIGLDHALAALDSGSDLGGRYFCLTLDDGFRSGFRNVAPILHELGIPAAFFLPTKYIGMRADEEWDELAGFDQHSWGEQHRSSGFLTWGECRELADAGFVIGSHTHSHERLTSLSPNAAWNELLRSKQIIEANLAKPCRHFCCPWGKVGRDFNPAVHPQMARSVGYESFLTAEEGLSLKGDSAFYVRRNGCEPEFHPSVLRYSFFSPFARRRTGRGGRGSRAQTASHSSRDCASLGRLESFEPALVSLGPFPYPYQAGFTVASDIDSASLERFRAVHALLGSAQERQSSKSCGRPGDEGAEIEGSSESSGQVPKLNLHLGDSFFLVADSTTFGMYRYWPQERRFQFDQEHEENCCDVIRESLRAGRIDVFHAFHNFSRAQLVPLIRDFYCWCEREEVMKPKVWINHSLAVTPTGLCPDELQQTAAERLIRLSGRKVIGPLLGRRPQPLRYAFARYQGDTPGSPYYVNDVLASNGLRYVWLNVDDLHVNRISLPEYGLNGRKSILQPVTMDDGVRYYRFERCFGKDPNRAGGEAYLRDSTEGFDATRIINTANLEALCRAGGTCILYVHWSHPRSFPIPTTTISRFELLKKWQDAGRIWVTSTTQLLDWTRRRTFLRVNCRREGKRLTIEIDGIDDPLFGREGATLRDLDRLCIHLPSGQDTVQIAVNGRLLNAAQVHRLAGICWLDAAATAA